MKKQIEGTYYLIYENGCVFSLDSNKFIKLHENEQGYLRVRLRIPFNDNGVVKNKSKSFFVHRLVAKAFIDNPENKKTVNHKDGNKSNNHISNLEWATQSENNKHAFSSGLSNSNHIKDRIGDKHPNSRPVVQISLDGFIVQYWGSAKLCQKTTEFHQSHINDCANGKVKQHKGFIWRYADSNFSVMQYR